MFHNVSFLLFAFGQLMHKLTKNRVILSENLFFTWGAKKLQRDTHLNLTSSMIVESPNTAWIEPSPKPRKHKRAYN